MELKVDTIRVVHWNDFDIDANELHLTAHNVSWGDASFTLISKEEMLEAFKEGNFLDAYKALSEIEGEVFVALPG